MMSGRQRPRHLRHIGEYDESMVKLPLVNVSTGKTGVVEPGFMRKWAVFPMCIVEKTNKYNTYGDTPAGCQ